MSARVAVLDPHALLTGREWGQVERGVAGQPLRGELGCLQWAGFRRRPRR